MANFPSNIRFLDASTFTEEQENTSITPAKMEGGYVITRPRHTRRPRRTFTFRYTMMTDTSKAALQTFWNTTRGGSDSFFWPHPISGENLNVRFAPEMKMKFDRIGFGPVNIWQSDTIILIEV